jgi:Fe-S-cluster formation regulator IscX/YfhJ
MAGEDARTTLGDAIAVYQAIENIDPARVAFLSAQLVSAVANLKDTKAAMARISERYGF